MLKLESDSIAQLTEAKSLANAKVSNLLKTKPGFNYKYVEVADYLDMIRIPYSEHGLALTQFPSVLEVGGDPYFISILSHSSGEWMKSVFPIEVKESKSMNDMQSIGSASTYLQKNVLRLMTGLAGEDDDGAAAKTNYAKPTTYNKPAVMQVRHDQQKIKQLTQENEMNKWLVANPEVIDNTKHKPYVEPKKLVTIDVETRLVIDELKKLCLEKTIPIAKFTQFHNIDSKRIETVKNAVENFDALLLSYQTNEVSLESATSKLN